MDSESNSAEVSCTICWSDPKRLSDGLRLLEKEDDPELDVTAAAAYKEEVDEILLQLQKHSEALQGRENRKARSEIGKEINVLKARPKYVDACRVAKQLQPSHGHFIKLDN